MTRKNFKQIFVAFLLLLVAQPVFVLAENVDLIADTLVCLPENSPVKLNWIVPPTKDQNFSAIAFVRKYQNFTFSMDVKENAWLGYEDRLICMNREFACKLSEPFLQMIHLGNGAMVFSTMLELGFASTDGVVEPGADSLPVLPFQAFARLPETYAVIVPFTSNSLVAVAEKNGKTIAYMLESDKGENAYQPSAIRAWKKLFAIDSVISAMASAPGRTYGKFWFAIDNYIYLFDEVDHNFGIRAKLPAGEKILQLAAVGDQIFYATEKNVGVIGITNHQVIMQTPFAKLCSRNGKLFVLLTGCMGVVEIQNINHFAKILN